MTIRKGDTVTHTNGTIGIAQGEPFQVVSLFADNWRVPVTFPTSFGTLTMPWQLSAIVPLQPSLFDEENL